MHKNEVIIGWFPQKKAQTTKTFVLIFRLFIEPPYWTPSKSSKLPQSVFSDPQNGLDQNVGFRETLFRFSLLASTQRLGFPLWLEFSWARLPYRLNRARCTKVLLRECWINIYLNLISDFTKNQTLVKRNNFSSQVLRKCE